VIYDPYGWPSGGYGPTTYVTVPLNCMSPGRALGLGRTTNTSGTITVEIGSPAPANGLEIHVIADPDPNRKWWLSINGNPAGTAVVLLPVPQGAVRTTFTVAVVPNNVPQPQFPATPLWTTMTLKARGFAPNLVRVRIQQ
jgi:hypothetical protein